MARSATVLKLPISRKRPAKEEKPARWQGEDDIFFHREQVKVGVQLQNFGRIDHATVWEVIQVKTYEIGRTGRAKAAPAGQVQKLSDDVVLRRVGANETRQVTFASLSYSAIWRLAK
jgi:hypothetical protein